MKLLTLLLTCVTLTAFAQPVSVGAKGGFVLTDSTRHSDDQSRNYTVGPTVEFRLPFHLGLETGFLYKRIGTGFDLDHEGIRYTTRTRGNSFEIPLVAKYYMRSVKKVTPFAGLGVAMRRTWQTTETTSTGPGNFFGPMGNFRFEDVSSFGAGAVGAAGLQIRQGRWKISPEFRYTRWSAETQRISRNPNQVEFLLGVSF